MGKYMFPAIFDPDDEAGDYTITFPDLPGCISQGEDMHEAMYMAKDSLVGFLYVMEEEGETIPVASSPVDIKIPEGAFLVYVEAWTDIIRDAEQNKTVKKTVTIPKWIDDEASKAGINFSQTLTFAIKQRLGVKQKD